MRWPSLGRQRRRSDTTASGSGAHGAPASSSAAQERAGDPGWAALAPVAPPRAAQPPLTARPMAATPPVIVEPLRRPRATPAEGAPEPGRVVGLTAVARPITPSVPAELPEYFRNLPPLRHAT